MTWLVKVTFLHTIRFPQRDVKFHIFLRKLGFSSFNLLFLVVSLCRLKIVPYITVIPQGYSKAGRWLSIVYYIAITGSASLQDTHLLGQRGCASNAWKAGPRKQPGPATWSGLLSRTDFLNITILVLPSGRVDPWLEPGVWCSPDPNRRLYSLSILLCFHVNQEKNLFNISTWQP